jgi:hypothetical protein
MRQAVVPHPPPPESESPTHLSPACADPCGGPLARVVPTATGAVRGYQNEAARELFDDGLSVFAQKHLAAAALPAQVVDVVDNSKAGWPMPIKPRALSQDSHNRVVRARL